MVTRETLWYGAFRAGVGLVGIMPRAVAVRLGTWAGLGYSVVAGRRRAMVRRHAHRLGIPADRVEGHVRRVFASYGRYWAETFWVRHGRRAEIDATIVLEGGEHVLAALAAGRGAVLALPHVGNWEFAGPLSDRLAFELVAVAENLANRRVRQWFVEVRADLGIDVVLAAGGGVTTRLVEALGRNAAVALLCDRDLGGRGVEVEFFGEATTLPTGPAALAARTGAALLPVAAYFADGPGHRVVVDRPVTVEGLEATTQELAHRLEDLIRAAPEQWHLLQPNWPSDR